MSDENELQIVPDGSVQADDLKLVLAPEDDTVIFNAGEGVVVKARDRDGGGPWRIDGVLSDETKARLAHLEAIETAMATVDHEIEVDADDHRFVVYAELDLHKLIRKRMKDNGNL